jgi:hypothetical protein
VKPHPELRRHPEQTRETQRGIGGDAALARHDFIQAVERSAATVMAVEAGTVWLYRVRVPGGRARSRCPRR